MVGGSKFIGDSKGYNSADNGKDGGAVSNDRDIKGASDSENNKTTGDGIDVEAGRKCSGRDGAADQEGSNGASKLIGSARYSCRVTYAGDNFELVEKMRLMEGRQPGQGQ